MQISAYIIDDFYSDGLDRWEWDGSSTLVYDGGC